MITTAVGNFPKVAEASYGTNIIGAITKWQRKQISDAALENTIREITRSIINEQERIGLDVLSDGQIRWEDLVTPFAKHLDGFEINGLSRWFDNNVYYRRPILHKQPVWKRPVFVDDYKFAASCAARPLKAILPGPYTFAAVSEDRFYKSERPFVLRMAQLLNMEARSLAKAGAPLIQFDEPALGFGKPNVKLCVEALRIATDGLNTRTALYTYFGSLNGSLEALMRSSVDVLGVDVVSSPKNLSELKKVKITKEIALGCLDARNTKLEPIKDLHEIFAFAEKLIPSEGLFVNPNSGLEFLPYTQAHAKLKRLVEAVRTYKRPRRKR